MLVRRFVTIFPAELKDLSTHADVAGTLNIWQATFAKTGNSILLFFQKSSGLSDKFVKSKRLQRYLSNPSSSTVAKGLMSLHIHRTNRSFISFECESGNRTVFGWPYVVIKVWEDDVL